MSYEGERVDRQQKDEFESLRNIYDDRVALFLANREYETLEQTAERLDIKIEDITPKEEAE